MRPIIRSCLSASVIASCGAFSGACAAEGDAEAVTDAANVPAAAKAALTKRAGDEEIAVIEREQRDGVTVYAARVKQRGLDRTIRVSENGTLISDDRHETVNQAVAKVDQAKEEARRAWNRSTSSGDALKLEDLPRPAQERISSEAGGNEIADIRGGVDQGEVSDRAEIRFPDGSERRIKVSENGELLSQR
jgi:hypothetical protein